MLLFATATLLAVAAFFGEMAEATSRAQGAFKAPKARTYEHLWEMEARSTSTATQSVTFFVKHRDDFDVTCPTMLEAISTPGSPQFMQQLKFEELKQFADPAAFETVLKFCRERFPDARVDPGPNMDVITVHDVSVDLIEHAFHVQLFEYRHVEDKNVVLRRPASEPRLPKSVAAAIDAISGLTPLPYHQKGRVPLFTSFAAKKNDKRQSSNLSTPQVLWQYYGIQNQTVAATAKQSIFAALGQSFDPNDLIAWQQNYNLPASVISKVIGPNDPSACSQDPNNCVEASLDVQQITSTAQLDVTTFRAVNPNVQDIFLDWINEVARDSNPPLVSSISYGSLAPEDPRTDVLTFNKQACKLGLRGVTIIVASGDDGVSNFGARSDPSQCGFTPSFPATSPFVTAVGASQGVESGTQELPCLSNTNGGITSGGGASIYFAQPSYQANAVKNYFAQLKAQGAFPPTSEWNQYGRIYPDVAMAGHNFPIEVGGSQYMGSGTSASAPLFASLVTLVNGQRVAAGKKPIGFLNPSIYHMAASAHSTYFNNVTSSLSNNCCAGAQGQQTCCQYGFKALYPYNAVTGFGSIQFGPWSQYLVNLQ
jgi:tripeptidyl-peptidase-1